MIHGVHQFDWNLRPFRSLAIVVPIVAVVAYTFSEKVPWYIWLAGIVWHALWQLWPIARVQVTDEAIDLSYFLPFRKSRRILSGDIRRIEPVALKVRGKEIPFWLRLHCRTGKMVTVWSSGTLGLAELTSLLTERFPPMSEAA